MRVGRVEKRNNVIRVQGEAKFEFYQMFNENNGSIFDRGYHHPILPSLLSVRGSATSD